MSWFQVGIGGWSYQILPECFQTLHRPSSGFAGMCKECCFLNDCCLTTHYIWWCNGYCRRIWTQRHDFKSWARLIAFHIALVPLGKVWIQLFSLQLWVNSRTDWVLQPCLGKGKLWIQTCWTPLKNWPYFTSCSSGGVSKYIYIYIYTHTHTYIHTHRHHIKEKPLKLFFFW